MYLLAGVFFVLSLCSCSMQIATNGNHQESSSTTTSSSSSESNSSEAPSIPENSNSSDISISDSTADSPSVTPDGISSSASSPDPNESASDTQASPDTDTLTRYDSIYDFPYAELDYDERGHNSLIKDGKPWVGAPGTDQFGEICFSDGHNFYIQCFLSYNDTLSTDFRWFCANLNHFDDEEPFFLAGRNREPAFYGRRRRYTLHRGWLSIQIKFDALVSRWHLQEIENVHIICPTILLYTKYRSKRRFNDASLNISTQKLPAC